MAALAHRAQSPKMWFEFGVEGLNWPTHAPVLNPSERLMDEPEKTESRDLLSSISA